LAQRRRNSKVSTGRLQNAWSSVQGRRSVTSTLPARFRLAFAGPENPARVETRPSEPRGSFVDRVELDRPTLKPSAIIDSVKPVAYSCCNICTSRDYQGFAPRVRERASRIGPSSVRRSFVRVREQGMQGPFIGRIMHGIGRRSERRNAIMRTGRVWDLRGVYCED